MSGDDKQWLLDEFRNISSSLYSNERREELAGELYTYYKKEKYDEAIAFLEDLGGDKLDFSSLITYLKNISNDDLIQEQEDNSASSAIDEGDKRALLGRMSNVDSDKVVGKVEAPANQKSLNLLSEQIYKRHNKLAFFISPTTTISGDIRQQIRNNKESIDLLKVCESQSDDAAYSFVHFGESAGKKNVVDKLTGDFYMYQFIAEDKEYIVFSQTEIDTGRVDITGTVFSLNDVTRVGDNRKITKSTDVIFAHSDDPAIQPLSDDELESIKDRATHEWFASRLFGEWRQPKLFEKLFIAQRLVKDENSWPSHVLMIGPAGTGKSNLMRSQMLSMNEHQAMMKGEQSTIKGAVPSFSQEPPDPGYLAKCHRVACIDEFFNLLDGIQDNKDAVFRKMLTLLEHDESNATSGNGSITVEIDATMIASTNPANGVDDFVQMAETLDEAFMSRCILYNYTKTHIDFIESRKPEVKKKKSTGGEDALYPDRNDEFVSFIDTMRERVSLMDQVDFIKVSEIKAELKHMVPSKLHEVYRSRYDHHMENILIGIAKYNSFIESRENICVTEKDYEDMKAIFEFVLQSWKQNPEGDVSQLSPEAQKAYLSQDKANVYNLVDTHNKMTMDEIEGYTDDEYVKAKVHDLVDRGLLKIVKLSDTEYVVPHWFSHGSEV